MFFVCLTNIVSFSVGHPLDLPQLIFMEADVGSRNPTIIRQLGKLIPQFGMYWYGLS